MFNLIIGIINFIVFGMILSLPVRDNNTNFWAIANLFFGIFNVLLYLNN